MKKRNLPLFVGSMAMLVLAGCGGSDRTVSYKSGGMTHTIAQGEDAIPKNFPLPIYPGATASGSVSAEADQNTEETRFLILTSTDPFDKIGDFYKKELSANGWKVETIQTFPKLVNIAATKGLYDCNVMLSGGSDKTNINLSMSKTAGQTVVTPPGDAYLPSNLTLPTD